MAELAVPSSSRRLWSHPVAWAVPLVVLVALAAHPLNGIYYDALVNSDPQGDGQLREWKRTTMIFQHTTGMLFGQLLALLAGAVLARRHRPAVALAVAVPLAAAMAAAAFVTGQLTGATVTISYEPLDDPLFVRMVVRELAAYPLFAWAGVGIAGLVGNRLPLRRLVYLVVPLWAVATFTGLVQTGDGGAPHWLYWAAPPVGAAAAVTRSGMSTGFGPDGPFVYGDWGNEASIALLIGAALYALVLNGLVVVAASRRATSPFRWP